MILCVLYVTMLYEPSIIKLHVLKRHTDMKKTIPCEVCGKLFRHISNLKCHFYTHKARMEWHHRYDTCNLTQTLQLSQVYKNPNPTKVEKVQCNKLNVVVI